MSISKSLAALTATALLVAGCGSNDARSGDAAGSSPAASTSTSAPQMSDQQAPPEQVVVDVTISGGKVTPTNEQVQASVGVPIILRVNSDAADQLHVHSNPEHTFTVEVPGRVDVELHELNRTIATITVQ